MVGYDMHCNHVIRRCFKLLSLLTWQLCFLLYQLFCKEVLVFINSLDAKIQKMCREWRNGRCRDDNLREARRRDHAGPFA